MGTGRNSKNRYFAASTEEAQIRLTGWCGYMKVPLAVIKGVLLGLALIGAVYFFRESCGVCLDAAMHIPDILFGDYEIATLPDSFSAAFFGWLAMEFFLFILLPSNDHSDDDQ